MVPYPVIGIETLHPSGAFPERGVKCQDGSIQEW